MITKEELIQLKSKLSPAKQALLEKRLQGDIESNSLNKSSQEELPKIVPDLDERYQPFPLTDVQQAYWIGRSGAFELSNVSTRAYLEIDVPNLDVQVLDKAWQRLIDHHEMLRAIVQPDGQQRILEQVPPYKVKVLELRGQTSEVVDSQLEMVRAEMSHQVLPAETWPLFEVRAAYLDGNKVRVFLNLEVLIVDAWSLELLVGELTELIRNPDIDLVPCELSFRDYVLAQIGLRDSQTYCRSQTYWQNRLTTLPPAPKLPLQKNLVAVKQPRFVGRRGKLKPETWKRLKERATESNLTPSGLLLAAFAEVLTLWSKHPRFTVNLTLFNRLPLHPDVNQIVGDFTSLTLLEVDNSVEESFELRSQRIQKQLWDDLEHRSYSGVQVLRELARQQKRHSGALMPVTFTSRLTQESLHRETSSQASIPGDSTPGIPQTTSSSIDRLGELVYVLSQTPQVFLDLQVSEREGTLAFDWDTVEELFSTDLLDDMFAAYEEFLNRLAFEEDLWHTTTRQLLPAKQLACRTTINATDKPVSKALLHTLFFEQARKRPQQPAVITSQRTLTYGELSARASQLGQQLRRRGARPNQLVAIVMEKGWEQIVAVLGTLASGAAYVPIDPGLPQERCWHLLERAEVQWVLTQSKFEGALEWPEDIERLCVDTLAFTDDSNPLLPVQQPSDLAYVIYTSGSTGLPKGVMIDHRGALNTILDINQRFQVRSKDRIFALSALNFDLSVYDIFGTLAAGATLVMPEAASTKDPADWMRVMAQHQVTLWNSVPALMQMLVEYAMGCHEQLARSLRLVLLSGDWLPLSLPEQIRGCSEQEVQVVSLGGATEASIWSILYPIEQVDPTWKSVPYGRPMVNQRFYVLNEALEPCPDWVPGQLYIGGIGLAVGYWRDEHKTNASFIIHPRTQERLYRTGDLGKYLPDGNIEFLGREDFQVKVNGHRIELGEIEATLLQHPAIKKAVVAAIGESREQQRLIAYVVPLSEDEVNPLSTISDSDPETAAWRSFLQEKLPEYMVPADFIRLDGLPLTANGKINRRALPQPESLHTRQSATYVRPQTEVEQLIAAIWHEVLQVEQVGIHDNFFELGGNSLLLVKVQVKLQEIFNQEISIIEIIRSPTIDSLAKSLSQPEMPQVAAQKGQSRAEQRKALRMRRRS